MDFILGFILLEGNIGAKDGIRRCHFDVSELSVETGGSLKDGIYVVQLIHILKL